MIGIDHGRACTSDLIPLNTATRSAASGTITARPRPASDEGRLAAAQSFLSPIPRGSRRSAPNGRSPTMDRIAAIAPTVMPADVYEGRQAAHAVELGPLRCGIGYAMRVARNAGPDAELVLRVNARSDGDPPHGLWRLVVSKDQRVALILVRDLIEGTDQADASLDRQDCTAEPNRLRRRHDDSFCHPRRAPLRRLHAEKVVQSCLRLRSASRAAARSRPRGRGCQPPRPRRGSARWGLSARVRPAWLPGSNPESKVQTIVDAWV